ncbi:MAG: LarC family nickel insertion protein [Eubacterium sp.]|nr:LarC family nickel insertion protein [Eubacterium sp.]
MEKEKQVLYLECKTGAAGDMLMSALYAVLPEEKQKEFLQQMNAISDEIQVKPEEKKSYGIGGIHMNITIRGKEEDEHFAEHGHHHHHHHGTSCQQMLEKIASLNLPDSVKEDATEIFQMIGEAESQVHKTRMDQIHFHEIGTIDALVDVVGCSYAIYLLGADRIESSPVCVGNGMVRCAHGLLPVPAPATAQIVKGMPIYSSRFDGELLTPTGAAVIKHFTGDYKKVMQMKVDAVGYGIGSRVYEEPSFVRIFKGRESMNV